MRIEGFGLWVWGFGFMVMVEGLGFGVWGLVFGVECSVLNV